MSDNYNKNLLAKNTILLYVRMLFTMWLTLYTTRLTLANLGVEDMGIYGVVGCIVSMFSVFSGGITTAIQRFLTYEIGCSNGNPNRVFCSCLNVIFGLSAIIFILMEIGGVWFLHNKANIPSGSMNAAQWVFQLSVITCLVNMISIPYNSLIIAHEKMNAFAFISILQVVMTCASAYYLSYFNDNRLIIYAIFMAIISILIRIIYQIYSCHKFKETRYQMIIDWYQIINIGKFVGISSVSGALQILSSQGFIIIMNLTFGVTINAVYTIAMQLKSSILSFVQNIQRAISPQIIKTYASKELELHKRLIYAGSKFQVYLIYFIMIPFLFHTEYIMQLWLKNVPLYAVAFAKCTIFLSLIYAFFETIRTSVYASGNITQFMILPEIIYLSVLPISYYTGLATNNPNILIIIMVVYEILVCFIRVLLATKVTIISLHEIIDNVLKPCTLVFFLSFTSYYILSRCISQTLFGLISLLLVNTFILSIIILAFGLNNTEKSMIKKVSIRMIKTLKNKSKTNQ